MYHREGFTITVIQEVLKENEAYLSHMPLTKHAPQGVQQYTKENLTVIQEVLKENEAYLSHMPLTKHAP